MNLISPIIVSEKLFETDLLMMDLKESREMRAEIVKEWYCKSDCLHDRLTYHIKKKYPHIDLEKSIKPRKTRSLIVQGLYCEDDHFHKIINMHSKDCNTCIPIIKKIIHEDSQRVPEKEERRRKINLLLKNKIENAPSNKK